MHIHNSYRLGIERIFTEEGGEGATDIDRAREKNRTKTIQGYKSVCAYVCVQYLRTKVPFESLR